MVSLRRRRLLGLKHGCNIPVELHGFEEFNIASKIPENPNQYSSAIATPIPSTDPDRQREVDVPKESPVSSISVPDSQKEEQNHEFPVLGQEIKRRKKHRRKQFENQEPCIMRGVYLKNMKWQAAIKVAKRQIHLGTVGSQEDAARLYDRAAFMCGREPNFELPEEEKEELRKLGWEEFLIKTRSSISCKKHQRRPRSGIVKKSKVAPPMQSNDKKDEQVNAPGAVLSSQA